MSQDAKAPRKPKRAREAPLPVNRDWFLQAFAEKGRSQRGLARHMGIDASAITHLLSGKRALQPGEAQQIATFLGKAPEEVLRAAGEPVRAPGFRSDCPPIMREALVVGLVDNDGRIRFEAGEQRVSAPATTPEGTVALRLTARQGWRSNLAGAMLYYRPTDRVEPGAVGRHAVVRMTAEGEPMVRTVHPGADIDRYDLVDAAGEGVIENVELAEAAPVLWIKP